MRLGALSFQSSLRRTVIATTAPIQHPPVEACLAQLLDHLGIAGAHFAGRSLADVQGFIAKYPERVATLTLVCPTVLNPRSLAPLGARLMVLTGDHGLGARRVQIQNKYEFIGHIAREDPIYTSIAYSEPSITIAGNNAIVRHRESIEAHTRAKRYLLEFGVLQVWQKQDDQWRLLARQGWKPEIT